MGVSSARLEYEIESSWKFDLSPVSPFQRCFFCCCSKCSKDGILACPLNNFFMGWILQSPEKLPSKTFQLFDHSYLAHCFIFGLNYISCRWQARSQFLLCTRARTAHIHRARLVWSVLACLFLPFTRIAIDFLMKKKKNERWQLLSLHCWVIASYYMDFRFSFYFWNFYYSFEHIWSLFSGEISVGYN